MEGIGYHPECLIFLQGKILFCYQGCNCCFYVSNVGELIIYSVHIHFCGLGYRPMCPGKPAKIHILNILFLKSKTLFSSRTHSNRIPYNFGFWQTALETFFSRDILTRAYSLSRCAPAASPRQILQTFYILLVTCKISSSDTLN